MFSFSHKPPSSSDDADVRAVFKSFINHKLVTKKNGEVLEQPCLRWQIAPEGKGLFEPAKRLAQALDLVEKAGNGDSKAMQSLLEGELYLLTEYLYAQAKHSSYTRANFQEPEFKINVNPDTLEEAESLEKNLAEYQRSARKLVTQEQDQSALTNTRISATLGVLRKQSYKALSENPRNSISKEIEDMDAAAGVVAIFDLYLKKGEGVFQWHSHNDVAQSIKAAINELSKTTPKPTTEQVEEVLQEKLNAFFREKKPEQINFKGDFMKAIVKAKIFLDKKQSLTLKQDSGVKPK